MAATASKTDGRLITVEVRVLCSPLVMFLRNLKRKFTQEVNQYLVDIENEKSVLEHVKIIAKAAIVLAIQRRKSR